MFFKRKKLHRNEDKVFKTISDKTEIFLSDITNASNSGYPVTICIHFENSLKFIEYILNEKNIEYKIFNNTWDINKFAKSFIDNNIIIVTSKFVDLVKNLDNNLKKNKIIKNFCV